MGELSFGVLASAAEASLFKGVLVLIYWKYFPVKRSKSKTVLLGKSGFARNTTFGYTTEHVPLYIGCTTEHVPL